MGEARSPPWRDVGTARVNSRWWPLIARRSRAISAAAARLATPGVSGYHTSTKTRRGCLSVVLGRREAPKLARPRARTPARCSRQWRRKRAASPSLPARGPPTIPLHQLLQKLRELTNEGPFGLRTFGIRSSCYDRLVTRRKFLVTRDYTGPVATLTHLEKLGPTTRYGSSERRMERRQRGPAAPLTRDTANGLALVGLFYWRWGAFDGPPPSKNAGSLR